VRRSRARARPLAGAREAVAARRLPRAWRGPRPAAAAAEDEALRARNAEAAAAGQPAQFIFRSLYLPEQGMFCQLPADLQLGTRLPVRPPARPAAPAAAPGCWLFMERSWQQHQSRLSRKVQALAASGAHRLS